MRRRSIGVLAIIAIGAAALTVPLASTAANAATIDLAIDVTEDGNGPFTPTQIPGGDVDDVNGIVRTNDTITYTVSVSSNAGPSTNERVTLTAPAGTTWAGVPAACSGPGSAITGQEMLCNVGNLASGQTVAIPALLNMGGGLANGDVIAITGSLTADDADNGPVVETSPDTIISASPRYDLQKDTDNSILTPNVAGPGGVDGFLIEYPILIAWKPIVPGQGLRGFEQTNGTFSFVDDVSQMYGGDPSPAILYTEDGEAACGPNTTSHFPYLPAGSGGAPRGTVDSGTFSCTQGAPGDPIQVDITGVDTSDALSAGVGANGLPLSGGVQATVVSGFIRLWVPTPPAPTAMLATNTYEPVETTSLSGQTNYPGETEPLGNNSVDRNLSANAGIGGYKLLQQVRDLGGGPVAGPGSAKSGSPFVTPGQNLRSRVNLVNLGTAPLTSAIACDTFDNRTQRITRIPGYGNYASTAGWSAGVRLEYAAYAFTDPASAQQQTCGDTDATWYTTPTAVPGGLDAIGMVRAVGTIPSAGAADLFTYTQVKLAPQNTRSYDFGHAYQGDTGDGTWTHDTNDPTIGVGGFQDSVIITENLARITKKIIDPGYDATTTPDATSFTSSGSDVDYALYPTLTNSTLGGGATSVTVSDILPFQGTYVPDSASIAPDRIEPYIDVQGRDRQRVFWELDTVLPNDPIAPITYTVHFSALARTGNVDNVAAVSSPTDSSAATWRQATRGIRIVTAGGVGVAKTAVDPVVINGDLLEWDLTYRNLDVTEITGVDLIDVLPWDDDVRGSTFTGTATLNSAVDVDAAAGETARYTAAAPTGISIDGNHASNQPGGATQWCTETDFTTAGCPASFDEVTAFRIERADPVAGGDTLTHRVTLRTTGTSDGDLFVNRYGLRASNLALPVQSNPAQITVVSGTIGDYVWEDTNENGQQDAGEPGIAGATVALQGTNDIGDDVDQSTTTDTDGDYRFTGLRPGEYTVTFIAPDGRSFTAFHAVDDTALDSDAGDGGASDPITLAPVLSDEGNLAGVQDDVTIDAGILPIEGTAGATGNAGSSGAGAGSDGIAGSGANGTGSGNAADAGADGAGAGAGGSSGDLPRTGATTMGWSLAAMLLIAGGISLVARRSRVSSRPR